jgi:hypothetical protein
MNLTIELSDEKVAALKAQAEAQGVTVERLLEQHIQPSSIAHLQKTDRKEWARQFDFWVNGHDPHTGRELHIVPQNLVELWVVATRPVGQNGLGMPLSTMHAWSRQCMCMGSLPFSLLTKLDFPVIQVSKLFIRIT